MTRFISDNAMYEFDRIAFKKILLKLIKKSSWHYEVDMKCVRTWKEET